MRKVCLPIFKVKVTVRVQTLKTITVCSTSPELLNLLQPNLAYIKNIVVHHQRVLCQFVIAVLMIKVTVKVEIFRCRIRGDVAAPGDNLDLVYVESSLKLLG